MARIGRVLPVALLLLGLPGGQSYVFTGSTSTGDIDTYRILETTRIHCPGDFPVVSFALTLLDPHPGDVVLFAAQGEEPHRTLPVARATFDQSTVTLVFRVNGCADLIIEVVGLTVEGQSPYRIRSR